MISDTYQEMIENHSESVSEFKHEIDGVYTNPDEGDTYDEIIEGNSIILMANEKLGDKSANLTGSSCENLKTECSLNTFAEISRDTTTASQLIAGTSPINFQNQAIFIVFTVN